jgi:site-specific recombinase XerD
MFPKCTGPMRRIHSSSIFTPSLRSRSTVSFIRFVFHPMTTFVSNACAPDIVLISSRRRPRSAAYALSMLNALYRWLIEQRYVLANPFAGVKVRGGRPAQLDTAHAFTEHEWKLARVFAEGLEWSYGWSEPAAQRLRFMLDFAFAKGLRISELVGAKLGAIDSDAHGDTWSRVIGKGHKAGKVVLPPLARALNRYLVQRGLPATPSKWRPSTLLIGSLGEDGSGISSWRLWRVMKRFFAAAAEVVEEGSPALADKLRQATPHWTRHTHAAHLLEGGAELTTVRDNLRHASLATTSMYLHTDDARRAKQVRAQAWCSYSVWRRA